jgi:hypothetical protein
VLWIAARRNAAQMVNLKTIWDWADDQLVHRPVDVLGARTFEPRMAVAKSGLRALPEPASVDSRSAANSDLCVGPNHDFDPFASCSRSARSFSIVSGGRTSPIGISFSLVLRARSTLLRARARGCFQPQEAAAGRLSLPRLMSS